MVAQCFFILTSLFHITHTYIPLSVECDQEETAHRKGRKVSSLTAVNRHSLQEVCMHFSLADTFLSATCARHGLLLKINQILSSFLWLFLPLSRPDCTSVWNEDCCIIWPEQFVNVSWSTRTSPGKGQCFFSGNRSSSFKNVSKTSRLRVMYFEFYPVNNAVEFLICKRLLSPKP